MDKIKNVAQRLGIITVKDMERYTALELIMMIVNKMNEFKEIINGQNDKIQYQNDKIQYLLDKGLLSEVVQIFDEWLQDGTFDTLINQSALEKVNEQLSEKIESITLNVRDFGAKGNWYTDDTEAIQRCLDYAKEINHHATIPSKSITIVFPYGGYMISKPIVMRRNAVINFNNSHIRPLNEMDYLWTFESKIRLPGIVLNDMVLHGEGKAKKGMWIKDVGYLNLNRIRTFAFIEHHIYADQSGLSGSSHFCINNGVMLNGVHSDAGGYANTVDAIGLEIRTTDCSINDLITRDFKTHIYNVTGINFYNHCHGWNQRAEVMAGSTHFKIGYDAKLVNCYSDTVTHAFDLAGNGRVEAIAHSCFTNANYYKTEKYGNISALKFSNENRTAKITFVGSRFDRNGVRPAYICESTKYIPYCEFIGCTSSFTTNGYLANGDEIFPMPAGTSIWRWDVRKTRYNRVEVFIMGDLTPEQINDKNEKTVLFKMPVGSYEVKYNTPITVSIEEYGATLLGTVCTGEINKSTGEVTVNLKTVPFTSQSNCKFSINTSYPLYDEMFTSD